MSTDVPTHVLASLDIARQYAALAAQLAEPFLTAKQGAAVSVAVAGLGIVMQAIQQQTDIADVDMASLDAQEVLILAADARAQAEAAAREGLTVRPRDSTMPGSAYGR